MTVAMFFLYTCTKSVEDNCVVVELPTAGISCFPSVRNLSLGVFMESTGSPARGCLLSIFNMRLRPGLIPARFCVEAMAWGLLRLVQYPLRNLL